MKAAALSFFVAVLASLAWVGCGAILGNLDTSVADAGLDAEAGASVEDGACVPPERTCAGKCGQLLDVCGALVDCGACALGQACGGGGTPNVCGSGICTPNCAGKGCGQSDGCSLVCTEGACDQGLRCLAGVCTCDTTSCNGCCLNKACMNGNDAGACGAGGGACATCSAPANGDPVCTSGACDFSCKPGLVRTGTSCTRHDTWTTMANMPTARAYVAGALGNDGRIYAIGGTSSSGSPASPLATVEAYTPDSNAWASVASMPTPRFGAAAVAGPDGMIYVIGGDNGSTAPLAVVEAYAPSTRTWSSIPPLPTARRNLAATLGPDGRIYAIGGYADSGATAVVEAYTFSTKTWAPVTSMLTARGDLAVATMAGTIYAVAGWNNVSPIATSESYLPSNNQWLSAPSLPTARSGAAGIALNGRIYIAGGYDGSAVVTTLSAYASGTWITLTNMTFAHNTEGIAVAQDGRIYVFGGTDASGPSAIVEAYTP
jgi:N-acetylneuraminic acid mutarotase